MRDILDILFPILTFGLFFAGIAAKARKKQAAQEAPTRRNVSPVAGEKMPAPDESIPAPQRPRTLSHSGLDPESPIEEGVRAIEHRSEAPTRRNVSPVAGEKMPAPDESIPAPQRSRTLEKLSEAEKLIVYSEIMHPKFEEN